MVHEVFGCVKEAVKEIVDLARLDWLVVDGRLGLEVLLEETSVVPPLWAVSHESNVPLGPSHSEIEAKCQ